MADVTPEELATKLELLQRQLNEMRTLKPETKVEVTLPPPRKLTKFNGSNIDVKDWIEDAKGIISSIDAREQINFLLRHLESTARKEVKLAPKSSTTTPQQVFDLLVEAFGETRSGARIKRDLYERMQGEREQIRDFTRDLLEITDKLNESESVKDNMLKEVLVENAYDLSVRRELKRMILEKPDLSFADLRSYAIKLVDTESGHRSKRHVARAHEVEAAADVCARDASVFEPLKELSQTMKAMMDTQLKILEVVSANQQQMQQVSSLNASTSSPRKPLSEIQCWTCQGFGHFSFDCPQRGNGARRGGRRGGRRYHASRPHGGQTSNQFDENIDPRHSQVARPSRGNASPSQL